MKKQLSQSGYSLLELLIYVGLFALLSIILIRSLVTVMRTYATAQAYRALQNNGELIMERITREVRSGRSISGISQCPTTGSTITITDPTNTTTTFSLSAGTIQIDGAALSTSEVSVASLALCSFSTSAGTGVKTKLVLTTTHGFVTSATFYATTILRGV